MTESNEIWMETDYQTEGVRSLEMAIEQLGKVLDDAYRWKWTIVAIHNALQAFMVAAVSGSDLLGAMTEEYAKHWYTQHEKGERPTQPERLASFAELFARIQQLKGYVDSQSLHPTPEQTRSVRALNRWRDDFVHYKPGSLSIEVSGYPGITLWGTERRFAYRPALSYHPRRALRPPLCDHPTRSPGERDLLGRRS